MQNPAKTADQLTGAPDDYLKEVLQDKSANSMSKIMALDEIKTRGSQRELAGGNPNQTSMAQEAMAKMGGQQGRPQMPPQQAMGGVAGLRPPQGPPMGMGGPQRPQPPRQFASGGSVDGDMSGMQQRQSFYDHISARMRAAQQKAPADRTDQDREDIRKGLDVFGPADEGLRREEGMRPDVYNSRFASGGIVDGSGDPMEERRRQLEQLQQRNEEWRRAVEEGYQPPAPTQGPPAPSRSPNWLDGTPPPGTPKPPQQGVGRPTIQMPTADQGLKFGWERGIVPPGPQLPPAPPAVSALQSSGGRGGGFEMTQPRPGGGIPVPPGTRPPSPRPRPQAGPVPGGIAGPQPTQQQPSYDAAMAQYQKMKGQATGPFNEQIAEQKKREQEAKDGFRTDAWMRLAEAGFGIASSKNPNFMGAIGEGALPASKGLQADRKELNSRLENMFQNRTSLHAANEAAKRGDVQGAAAIYAQGSTDLYRQQTLGLDRERNEIARIRAGKAGRTSIDALSELVHGKPISDLTKEERLELLTVQKASKSGGDERQDVVKKYVEARDKAVTALTQSGSLSPEAEAQLKQEVNRYNTIISNLTGGELAEQGVSIKSEGSLNPSADLQAARERAAGRAR